MTILDVDVTEELVEIGRIIDSANLLNVIRDEVHAALKDEGAVVVGGQQANLPDAGRKYDVVIIQNSVEHEVLARRIRDRVPEIEIDRLVPNVMGIRTARRGSK